MRLFTSGLFTVLLLFCLSPLTTVHAQAEGWPLDATDAAKQQTEASKRLHVPQYMKLKVAGGTPLTLVLIPAGSFMMGSPESETVGSRKACAVTNGPNTR